MAPQDDSVHLQLDIPQEQHAGEYAEIAAVWHTKDGFTIDFIAPLVPARPHPEGEGQVQPATVVSRIRLPVGVIFQVARAISENVAIYEATYGPIGAGGPDHPPEEDKQP